MSRVHQDIVEGGLTVVTGCTQSRKTDHITSMARRLQYRKHRTVLVTPSMRGNQGTMAWLDKGKPKNVVFISKAKDILKPVENDVDVVMFDDAHFFDFSIFECIEALSKRGISVVISGLNLDCNGEPIGYMPQILALADDIHRLHAVCVKCGTEDSRASRSQRVWNGRPIGADEFSIVLKEELIPVCSKHFVKPKFSAEYVDRGEISMCSNCLLELPTFVKITKCPVCGAAFTNAEEILER